MNTWPQLVATYRQLRLMAGVSLFVVPVAIVLIAYVLGVQVLPTLSHYYFGEPTPGLVRTLFTGFLVFVGGIMIAYRGFDDRDNWVHNAAGVAAIAVALFPKPCDSTGEPYCTIGLLTGLHVPAAVLMFLFAAYAVLYSGGRRFQDRLEPQDRTLLRRAKSVSLLTMLVGVALYVVTTTLAPGLREFRITMLVVELLGFFGFGGHWIVMTLMVDRINKRRASSVAGRKPTASIDEDLLA